MEFWWVLDVCRCGTGPILKWGGSARQIAQPWAILRKCVVLRWHGIVCPLVVIFLGLRAFVLNSSAERPAPSGCRVYRRPQSRWGFHTTAREPKSAHLRVPAFNHTTKFQRNDPQERRKKENCGGRGKKRAKFWAVRRKGVRRRGSGGGVRVGGESGERPNFGRTHENFEHTPHRQKTQHKGGPSQGGPWPKKQDMSNKLSRRAAPLAKVFWVQGWFANFWAQNGL